MKTIICSIICLSLFSGCVGGTSSNPGEIKQANEECKEHGGLSKISLYYYAFFIHDGLCSYIECNNGFGKKICPKDYK